MWKWIKIPKGVALLAFALPWMTVSCGNQKFINASGVDLVMNRLSMVNPMTNEVQSHTGSPNVLLILAVVAIVLGLVASFAPRKLGAPVVIATSVAGLILTWIGTSYYSKSAFLAEAAKERGGRTPTTPPSNPFEAPPSNPFGSGSNPFDPDMSKMAGLIQVNWELGFWITSLALVAAAVMAWLAFTGREGVVARAVRTSGTAAPVGGDAFAEQPLSAGPPAETTCPACGRHYPLGTHFCPEDGTALA